MKAAGRLILAVLAGAAVWAVLWGGGTRLAQVALPDLVVPERRLEHVGVLLAFIAWSVILSVLAGWVTGRTAGTEPLRAVWALAVLQLGLGIVFEVSYWGLMPVWYHLIFLALIVPATVYGGMRGAP